MGGGGGETQPPNRPTQEHEPDGREGAAPQGVTESRGGGDSADSGYSPAQTPDAAQAVAEGAQGRARPAPEADTRQLVAGGDDNPRSMRTTRGGGDNDDAGHSTAQTPVADQAASEGAQGSARTALSPGSLRQKAGGEDTPRREGETGRVADEAMTERAPLDQPRAPNVGGHRGDGTAQRTEGGDNTPRSESAEGRTADKAMTERAPRAVESA